MIPEERIKQLETENAPLRGQIVARDALNAQLVERIQALEARLSQDNHNSSKPPSSDGFVRPPKKRSLCKAVAKNVGGQNGHQGYNLQQVEHSDEIIEHFPIKRGRCWHNLTTVTPLADFESR